MASEDVLPQIFADFYQKANPDSPSDNQQLNKIEVPNDQMTIGITSQSYTGGTNLSQSLSDKMTIGAASSANTVNPSTFLWGGMDTNGVLQYGGWDWGIGGAWG